MLKKILVANRGEIACRIIRAARKLGIKTVAIFSDVDSNSLHVEMADEAVFIGSSSLDKSYLNPNKIMAAINKTGADAVHPGYGFLSENEKFAKIVKKSGKTFIGPHPKAISLMGDKIQSKKIAVDAGINTIPGYGGAVRNLNAASKEAERIGYPVMLKATSGGGGKGMRIVHNSKQCQDALVRTQSEAAAAFDDNRVFIEQYIENPRHIEVQILADQKGNIVYFPERECSIQRRHQKIIEESPSIYIDDEIRYQMGMQAVSLAKAVNYFSAGTVEFLVDQDKNFYFLEMNTRLQVEHAVTEMITGIDLVEWMIRIASGENLDFSQDDISISGWSIESRIYAEDPANDFLPSTGRLTYFRPPVESKEIRVDMGIKEGDVISIHFDPMIAKVISYASTRREAIYLMSEALDAFLLKGVSSNINFLSAIMSQSRFIDGRINTNFIKEEFPEGFCSQKLLHSNLEYLLCGVAAIHQADYERSFMISGQISDQIDRLKSLSWVIRLKEEKYTAKVSIIDSGYQILLENKEFLVESNWKLGDVLFKGRINGNNFCFQIEKNGISYLLTYKGKKTDFLVLNKTAALLQIPNPRKNKNEINSSLLSPMPGMLISIDVSKDKIIKKGDQLAVIEAMKMENVLRAEFDCVVSNIIAKPGDILGAGQVIMEFKDDIK